MTSLADTNLFYADGHHPVHGTWLSVDVVAFTENPDQSAIALIRREGAPHRGETTLPGGLLAAWNGETVSGAARRIVYEKLGVRLIGDPVTIGVVSDPGRDERGHTVSIVVAARVPVLRAGIPGGVLAADVPADMPFGHSAMVGTVRSAVDNRLLTDPELTRALLGEETSLSQVTAVLRACGDQTPPAIRARMSRSPLYRRTGRVRHTGAVGRPESVYAWSG